MGNNKEVNSGEGEEKNEARKIRLSNVILFLFFNIFYFLLPFFFVFSSFFSILFHIRTYGEKKTVETSLKVTQNSVESDEMKQMKLETE